MPNICPSLLNENAPLPQGYMQHFAGRWRAAWHAKKTGLGKQAFAYPEPRKRILKELASSTLLGKTGDGKLIYLFDYCTNSSVMREIGRLREISFRHVGEGTNKTRDIDRFDKYYRHIILWEPSENEIVGSYRIGEAFNIVKRLGVKGLYSSKLFHYQPAFDAIFPSAIELGRSFIQPKYWGKKSLDYLWLGIGAYLNANPQVRYMFGAVSISNDYSDAAKQELIGCFSHHLQPSYHRQFAYANEPYLRDSSIAASHAGKSYKESFKELKASLNSQNLRVPTLYKHYTDLCGQKGTRIIDFNIDPLFNYSVDALMLSDLRYIKAKKYQRYIGVHSNLTPSNKK